MKFLPLLATAFVAAEAVSASMSSKPHHSLFARHERRTPVELYTGEDPQLEMVKRNRAELAAMPKQERRSHFDHLDVNDYAPTDLQKRQASTTSPGTGTAYPPAGSDSPAANTLPKVWVDKYNAVKAAGLIPNIPPSKENAAGTVDYPKGTDLNAVCSWTNQKCFNGDIYQAPDNSVAFGIDDGPTPNGTANFIDVFKKQNITATHFLIGSAIVWNQDALKLLANASPKQNLAIHTWSHTLQTTKTDLEIVGELGWTAQIIYDVTGYIPNQARMPEGDVDNRVRAIAKYVFGMQSVMWTHDADDWCLRQGKGTAKEIQSCVQTAPNLKTVTAAQVAWASPKTNNTGWITLNHETTDQASEAFDSMVQATQKAGWNIEGAVPNLQGLPWYNNAYGPNDKPTKQDNILPTKDFINVTDPTAAKGSAAAPKLGNWAKTAATQNPSVGTQASGGGSGGSSSSSGAMEITVNTAFVSMAVLSIAIALSA